MSKTLVIGGGAAGMFAAIAAAGNGHEVHVYEKNEKLGKKLFITGKGRCNITNACDMETLFDAVVTNSKFLYSSFYGYTNQNVIDFFEQIGVKTKVERGERVFPQSDHSSDVIRALEAEMRRRGVQIHLYTEVRRVVSDEGRFSFIELTDGSQIKGDACIVATGGLSYQTTGSTGDGHRFAKENGHSVTPCMPALVPMTAKEDWVPRLQGLSLRNVSAVIYDGKKRLYEEFGEMLFTHYGVSGPLMLSASSIVGKKLREKELKLVIDLKPALSMEQLEKRVLRDFEENQNRQFKNAVGKLFPAKLIPVMIELSGIDEDKKVNIISREERQRFVSLIKNLPVTLTGLRGYNEAIITKGGVKVKEIDPGTMESKLVKGLCFAGEVLDLDAVTGGFNLQIAWSTGYAAGMSV
ncbi:MAG: NAD(P)/FAD-dependent oxidoreductase [Lachnospiraceae bacterium]|uniref:NAD(P)/FAD-dependent oxidoreductase n=1 Tax=Dorea phocaeensis TaxID=2040291 RepID=A0A850HFN9_9FIRM|nr:NAD(P)/FAD-dependent oxidoreductase [Dorea phocaeensis]MBS5131720.1 NAD(P)/FAD-dependent oxidoreductase [Lachnospiraceae bacterium]NSK13550.1 NAD(P)/FAD-dependent oxidoreductase [Dorea phocaeensis]NVH57321.1 NAD(P)/FAD-dependent oxidoreductase [Dorea phocaeensis]